MGVPDLSQGNCLLPGVKKEWWSPPDRLPGRPKGYKKKYLPWLRNSAAKLCAGCPVVVRCAQLALEIEDVTGIFAGTYIPPATQKTHEAALINLRVIAERGNERNEQ